MLQKVKSLPTVAIQQNWFLQFLESHDSRNAKSILTIDWSQTVLGPVESWPESLKLSLSICLNATDRAIAIYWHEPKNNEFYFFFNDCFEIITREKKEPLGKYASEVWSEIWPTLELQFSVLIEKKQALSFKNTAFSLERNGLKEAYFDYDLIPIPLSDGSIGGIFNIAFETTESILIARRTKVLEALSMQMTARNKKEACSVAIESIQDFPEDIPLAVVYLMDENKQNLQLEASFNVFSDKIPQSHPQIPRYLTLEDMPIRTGDMVQIIMQVVQNKKPQILEHLQVVLGMAVRGIWPEIIEKKELAFKIALNIANAEARNLAKDLISVFQNGLEPSEVEVKVELETDNDPLSVYQSA